MNRISIKQSWLVAFAAIVLVGCNKGDDTAAATTTSGTTGSATTASNDKPLELAFVTNNVSDYWIIAQKGVEKAEGELKNVTVDFKEPPTGVAAEQKTIIDDLLAKGVQGIAISPTDPANQTKMINDTAKQALVVTQDSDAPLSNRACYIGTDNVAAGVQAGQEILKALPNGGTIMAFVGSKDAQNAKDRFDGVLQALKGSKVQVIDERTDETDKAKAVSNVADALVKYPDLSLCLGLWSYNGPAILNALKQAKKTGAVKIVCFDSDDDTLQGIKDGFISATIVQQPFVFGEKAIQVMTAYLRGDKSAVPDSKKMIVPTQVIDKSNVDQFWADQKKLTGK